MSEARRHPDTFASDFIPPEAVLCWCNDTHIYIAIPATDPAKPPYVTSYAKTEGGLSKALSILHRDARNVSHPSSRPERVSGIGTKHLSPSQRMAALRKAILK